MSSEENIASSVANIATRLQRLRAVTEAQEAAAATVELDGLAHALRQLDLVLRTHRQLGEPAESHDEIVAYLANVKAELLDHMHAFGLSSREKPVDPAD